MDQDTNYIILSNQCIIIELLYALMELGLALHEKIIPERQGMRQYLAETHCAWLLFSFPFKILLSLRYGMARNFLDNLYSLLFNLPLSF